MFWRELWGTLGVFIQVLEKGVEEGVAFAAPRRMGGAWRGAGGRCARSAWSRGSWRFGPACIHVCVDRRGSRTVSLPIVASGGKDTFEVVSHEEDVEAGLCGGGSDLWNCIQVGSRQAHDMVRQLMVDLLAAASATVGWWASVSALALRA